MPFWRKAKAVPIGIGMQFACRAGQLQRHVQGVGEPGEATRSGGGRVAGLVGTVFLFAYMLCKIATALGKFSTAQVFNCIFSVQLTQEKFGLCLLGFFDFGAYILCTCLLRN
jgi:hypothetical protein